MTIATGKLPAEGVERMFDRIAPIYDLMNRVMTGGLDRHWRRITIEETVSQAIASSTRAVAPAISRSGSRQRRRVVGLDFSERMLERARRRTGDQWVRGDARCRSTMRLSTRRRWGSACETSTISKLG
jgi:demethylmenaquinone methyltransferase/2-methoxy-6-polyprenyl-1,4-benzoquinol methylase